MKRPHEWDFDQRGKSSNPRSFLPQTESLNNYMKSNGKYFFDFDLRQNVCSDKHGKGSFTVEPRGANQKVPYMTVNNSQSGQRQLVLGGTSNLDAHLN